MRALAPHQCDPGSNPNFDTICGLSLLLVLSFTPRGFSLQMCTSENILLSPPPPPPPTTEGTFTLDPHPTSGISIPGGACQTPSTLWNLRDFPSWLGLPWKECFLLK